MEKKIGHVLLFVILTVIIVLTGCGKDSAGIGKKQHPARAEGTAGHISGSKYQEFITVDVFDTVANYQGTQSGWFAKVVKDKFNMELNIIAPNVAGKETLF